MSSLRQGATAVAGRMLPCWLLRRVWPLPDGMVWISDRELLGITQEAIDALRQTERLRIETEGYNAEIRRCKAEDRARDLVGRLALSPAVQADLVEALRAEGLPLSVDGTLHEPACEALAAEKLCALAGSSMQSDPSNGGTR